MTKRVYTLSLTVTAPTTTGERDIANAVNAALDEPPCDWGEWMVGAAMVTDVKLTGEDQ